MLPYWYMMNMRPRTSDLNLETRSESLSAQYGICLDDDAPAELKCFLEDSRYRKRFLSETYVRDDSIIEVHERGFVPSCFDSGAPTEIHVHAREKGEALGIALRINHFLNQHGQKPVLYLLHDQPRSP